jgi:anti-sigma regulatory factor (Ser/Thr protein kinase)
VAGVDDRPSGDPQSQSAPRSARFTHAALFYTGPTGFLDEVIPFIEAGLRDGDPVAVCVPGSRLDLVRQALGPAAEQVVFQDMLVEGANPGRLIPAVVAGFADQHQGRHVRIVGEVVGPWRSPIAYPACAQHEALLNLAFPGRDMTILCAYDTLALPGQALADACATHPLLTEGTDTRPSGEFDPLRILQEYNQLLPSAPPGVIEREAQADTIAHARWFATAYGHHVGLSATALIDLEIAVTELVTNSIQHGGGTARYRLWTEQDMLVCEVSDTGHLIDPLAGRRPRYDAAPGTGLLLVNLSVDLLRMHTSPGGTTIRIYIRRTRR